MVSSEMAEVLGMSDRIVVMREGRVSAILDTVDATQEKILSAAMAATIRGRPLRRRRHERRNQRRKGASARRSAPGRASASWASSCSSWS